MFCFGQVAAALALDQIANVSGRLDNGGEDIEAEEDLLAMARQDDIFVTGLLTERLPLHLTDLSPGTSSKIWDLVFSKCPLLATIKQLFFNKIVLRKGPESLPYVNGPGFFICCCLESQLTSLESLAPSLAPLFQPIWEMCARK